MSDLTGFLLARVQDDEDAARAAAARNGDEWTASHLDIGAWRVAGSKDIGANPRAYNGDTELWDDEGALGMHAETAAHVARFDPARVLAECEAKRRIIRLHPMESEPEEINTGEHRDDPGSARGWDYVMQPTGRTLWGCANCDAFEGNDDSTYTFCNRPASGCETLLCLAAVYSDHPDFDPVWVVSGE